MVDNRFYKRGGIWECELVDSKGSVQQGNRGVIIVSNDLANTYSSVVEVVALTSSESKTVLPTHLVLEKGTGKLAKTSTVVGEQIMTVSKSQLKFFIGSLRANEMKQVDAVLNVSLGLVMHYEVPIFEQLEKVKQLEFHINELIACKLSALTLVIRQNVDKYNAICDELRNICRQGRTDMWKYYEKNATFKKYESDSNIIIFTRENTRIAQ